MRHILAILSLLIIANVITFAGCGRMVVATRPIPMPPTQGAVVDIGIFYDELAPYGEWFEVEEYGWVWTPSGVPVGWRPYTDGYWVYSDYGWTWVSTYSWGWAPFHYGRWVFHPRHGWVWIPGRVWGPAWVVWRYSPGWVGWAPMPPQRGWRVGMGFRVVGDPDGLIEPHGYDFVAERYFADRNLNRHFELEARNVTLMQNTRNVTNYLTVENRIVNRSIDFREIERATGKRIIERRIVDGRPGAIGRGNDLPFYRPNIGRDTTDRTPRRIAPPSVPPRPHVSPNAERERREARERQELERAQERERRRLDGLHRQEQARPPVQLNRDEIQRRQEAERRAQEDQRRREQDVLRDRQERRRQTENPRREGTPRRPSSEGAGHRDH